MASRAFSDWPTLSATMGLPRLPRLGRDLTELRRLPETLDEDADDLCVLVLDEELDVVLDGDAGLVAAGDDVAQTDLPLLHEVLGDRVTEPAALRDEPDRPGSERLGEVGAEGRHALANVEHAVAVRAADEQATLGGQRSTCLARLPTGRLAEAVDKRRRRGRALNRGLQESRTCAAGIAPPRHRRAWVSTTGRG